MKLQIDRPHEKQKQFLTAKAKYIGYGGARGGGKSWAVRTKAMLMALNYPGIKQLIVRRTYPELVENHIRELRRKLLGIARYNDKDKVLLFPNGSMIKFMYCAKDNDLDRLQGTEFDVIYLDEATQLSEYQIKSIAACLRGVNDFPKRMYFTMNPGGQGHAYIKRIFVDRKYQDVECAEDYCFIQALPSDNPALMKKNPDYLRQLEALPPKLRAAWLEGRWDIYEGQFFEEFRDNPEGYRTKQWTHVIEPFDIPRGWNVFRSFDWGYNKPFSLAWYAVDYDGVIYRIHELYGCTKTPNEGVRWHDEKIFAEAARIEQTHRYLAGRQITGVADPAIWDASHGISTAETAAKYRIYFTPGDHARIAGWMQCHYRLAFDENGYAKFYCFSSCDQFIRTIPMLCYDEHKLEDIDTDMEDHIADEWRYAMMSRPLLPDIPEEITYTPMDPLDMAKNKRKRWY
ncbi:MAG: phage terminase large subunit [Clostridia bacterium]|nr:phage terminase large subunit [Clostridia bacterium]